jgi:hypothetical protein
MVNSTLQGLLGDGNNYEVDLFEAEVDQEALGQIDAPAFDREYLFAVLTYLFPGMLTRLLRAAVLRHQGNEVAVNNNVQVGQFQENILEANQGLAIGFNNKALRNLQKAFGRAFAHNAVDVNRQTHRLDGHLKATKAYCARTILEAYNGILY